MPVASHGRDRLVRHAGRHGVDGVVQEVDGDLLLAQKMNGGAMSRAGSVTAALPQIAAPWAAVARAGARPDAPSKPRTTPHPVP